MTADRVTIIEIAKKANLSIATVSRAINPATQHLVKKSTTNRVLSIIKRENFSPSIAAKSLATGKSNNIVVFFRPDPQSLFYNDYYSKMIAGSMKGIESTPYTLLTSVIKNGHEGFDVDRAIRRMDTAAAILCNFMGVFKLSAKNIFNLDVPILFINQYQKEKNPNCFLIDNFTGAYDAASYLINRGHRRIGFVRGTRSVKDAEDRYHGFLKALASHRIKNDPALCYQGDFVEASGKAAAHYFFKAGRKGPTAVFCANDTMAISMMNELRSMEIICPRDISIMGFDGIDAGRYTYAPLTTVRQPIYEMAMEAVREVINIVDNKEKFKGTRFFKARIIERGSVASI